MENIVKAKHEVYTTKPQTWGLNLVNDLILHGIHELCVQSFNEIIVHGKAQTFVNRIHRMASIIASANRKKVVNSLFCVINSMRQMYSKRKDVGETYLYNCTEVQNIQIELLNSLISNLCPNNDDLTAEKI